MNALNTCFRNIVVLGLIFLFFYGLCGTVNAYTYACPVASKRIPELVSEKNRIQQGYDPWDTGYEISAEEKTKMIQVIDSRIEGFKKDNEIYSNNKRDNATANRNAQRLKEAREAREWMNNYNREWNEIATEYLSLSDTDRAEYRSQISPEQQAELDRFVNQQSQMAAQASSSQVSGSPNDNVSTNSIAGSIDTLDELSSDLVNGIVGGFVAGGTVSGEEHAGEATDYEPCDLRDDVSPSSGSPSSGSRSSGSGQTGIIVGPIECEGGSIQRID